MREEKDLKIDGKKRKKIRKERKENGKERKICTLQEWHETENKMMS